MTHTGDGSGFRTLLDLKICIYFPYRKEVRNITDTIQELTEYYDKWLQKVSLSAVERLEDLSYQVAASQKSFTWYLYLDWRSISEVEFVALSLTINYLMYFFTQRYEKKRNSLDWYVMHELVDQLKTASLRFRSSHKGKIWCIILQAEAWNSLTNLAKLGVLLPITEWEGNYKEGLVPKWLERHFSLRYNTPRRLKKQERIRGYRDHGTMSSPSESARRRANESQLRGITQEGYVVNWDEFSASLKRELEHNPDPDSS
jgi:hypothetical protein